MADSTSKTKTQLLNTARELFATKGKKNVTMNDIAETSQKGRRTLYTYFKNKDEVYKDVVENEVNLVIKALVDNVERDVDPYTKLKDHIIIHLDTIKNSVTRNGTLRADFFKDIYEVERTRRKLDNKELKLIKGILDEGIEKDIFKEMNTEIVSVIILYSLKGLEVPYIRQKMNFEFENSKDKIVEFVFSGIKKGC